MRSYKKRLGIIGIGVSVILIIFWGVLYLSGAPFPFWSTLKPYNVILINIDTLRADHLGVYGYSRDTSPNIDQFAKESVMFEQAFSQAPFSLSSHSSIFTSQYPSVHGVLDLESKLSYSKVTLAEVLRENGYNTAAFTAGGQVRAIFGLSQGFDVFIDSAGNSFIDTMPLAEEWLQEIGTDRFFLFLQGYDVHAPYHKPEPFDHMFDSEYDGILSDHDKFYFDYNEIDSNSILHRIKKIKGELFLVLETESIPLEQQDLDHIIAHYDSGIRYTDGLIQDFLDKLKSMELYDNSIIMIFSDHGESLDDSMQREEVDGRILGHGLLYDENIHVPLLIKYPGSKPQTISAQAQLIDIFPTITDLLGISLRRQVKQAIQGISLIPLIEGNADIRKVFTEGTRGAFEAVRTLQWKLISLNGERPQLYNLKDDPKEIQNVAGQYSDILIKLEKALIEQNFENLKKKI